MIGSFLTRGLVMAFGYAYPAYECYKTVEMNKPEIEQLRFWCQYWILVAILSVCERIGDTFISWVPMYSEAKLAFFIYLWYPKTKGTTYVYCSFFRPYISKHETEIDRNLLEMRTKAGDFAVLYWQKAASYIQTRTSDILQYIASQSTSRPRSSLTKDGSRGHQTAAGPNKRPGDQNSAKEPPSPTSSTSSQVQDAPDTVDPSQPPKNTAASLNAQQSIPTKSLAETLKQPSPEAAENMQIESASSSATNENGDPVPPQEAVTEEAIRVTRGRLSRNRAAANR